MEFNEYQELANRTLYGTEQVLTNCALGLASETGAVLEQIQKYTFESQELNRDALIKELGDVLWYVSQISDWASIPFEEVATKNLAHIDSKMNSHRPIQKN